MRKISAAIVLITLVGCAHSQRSDEQKSAPVYVGENAPRSAGFGVVAENGEYATVTGDDLSRSDVEKVPMEMNRLVLKWIEYFQGRGHNLMTTYLSRGGRYLPMMEQVFEKNGLPKSLVYIALIESGFSPRAQSSAGAVGYWQFMRGTGKDYDLQITKLVDERRDPQLATEAAAKYFKGLYSLFGDWYLAMAAYNVGENRIKSVVMKTQTRDFWEIAKMNKLPAETVNYVPKYLAARMIAKNPAKYGFTEINYDRPFEFDVVESRTTVNLRKLADQINVDYDDLKDLNPKYKREYAVLDRSGRAVIRIPKGKTDIALQNIDSALVHDARVLASVPEDDYSFYKVKSGDTLAGIARHFHMSLTRLKKMNNVSSRFVLRVGEKIKVPASLASDKGAREERPGSRRKSSSRKVVSYKHVVKRGETLAHIAKNYSVDMQSLLNVNRMNGRKKLLIGSTIVIPQQYRR